jgi:hypothetical protein
MNEHANTVMTDTIMKYISSSDENKANFNAYMAWLSYYGGLSGQGATSVDIKPAFNMPFNVPTFVRMEMVILMEEECQNRWENFRQAMIETISEDPGEGWTIPKELRAEFDNAHKENEWLSSLKDEILNEVEIKIKRLTKISSSLWLIFVSLFTGEYKKLHKEVRLMFECYDRFNAAQTGEKTLFKKEGKTE